MRTLFESRFTPRTSMKGSSLGVIDWGDLFGQGFTAGLNIYSQRLAEEAAEEKREAAEAAAAAAAAQAQAAAAQAAAVQAGATSSDLIPGVSNTVLLIGGAAVVLLSVFLLTRK